MTIKIIIPILNPSDHFFMNSIPCLLQQTYHCEILLINSGGAIPDGTFDVHTIQKEEFNHANTRNLALNYTADFYLFMTQDAAPCNTHLVENLLKPFQENNDVVVSYAHQIPYHTANPIEIFARKENYPSLSRIQSYDDLPSLGIKTFFNSNSCAMYRGEYFRALNGFKPNNNTSEDMEFAARAILARKKVAYVADAEVYHSHNFTLTQVWKRYREIGKFFALNPWILNTVSQYKRTESTGIKQAFKELRYLIHYAPHLIPKSLLLSCTKYIAFKSSF